MRPLSTPALVFLIRRYTEELKKRGVDLSESTRHILIDDMVVGYLAEELETTDEFVAQAFDGVPVAAAQGMAAGWLSKLRPYRRVEALERLARKKGRYVSGTVLERAYRYAMGLPMRGAA